MRISRIRAFLWLSVVSSLLLLVESQKKRGKIPAFEKLVNKLWELDANRLEINKDIILNLQGFATKPLEDNAPELLFTFANGTRLYNTPTFRAFIDLMRFYNPNVLVVESSSPEKIQSQKAFLDAILATPVMAEVRRYLEEKKLASPIDEEFKDMLGHLWFSAFKRKKRLSSSAFEHVFLGEGRGTKVLGFHYWLPLYLHEQEGSLNYFGYYEKGQGGLQNLLSVAFEWNSDWVKKHAKFLVGTSPEFEMGVYTAAFLTMNSIWPDGFRYALSLRLNRSRMAVQCYRNSKVILGSCYIV